MIVYERPVHGRPPASGYTTLLPDPIRTGASQWWTFGGLVRSIRWSSSPAVVLKDLRGFGDTPPADLRRMLPAAAARGIPRPSSWASLYWDGRGRPRLPAPRHGYRRLGGGLIRGGWQQVIGPTGYREGPWIAYDVRSAYLAAILEGLPDPWTYRYHARYGRRPPDRAVWIVDVQPPRVPAPWPITLGGPQWLTTEEVARYGQREHVRCGVSWSREIDTRPVGDYVASWGEWARPIARTVWGRWLGSAPLRVYSAAHPEGRALAPLVPPNPIWAHLITRRVREWCWQIIRRNPHAVARVYVDSLLVRPDVSVQVGQTIGAWRPTAHYPRGVIVTMAGAKSA